jgi:hypothetical protein
MKTFPHYMAAIFNFSFCLHQSLQILPRGRKGPAMHFIMRRPRRGLRRLPPCSRSSEAVAVLNNTG